LMALIPPTDPDETDRLLREAARGDQAALRSLLERHRERLRRMVALRLDPRISARVDASDVVQKSRHPRTRRSDQSASASTFPLRASRRSERARIEPTVVSLRSLDVGSGMVRPVETASGGGSSVRGGNTLRVEA
jgi:hypothetical protein